MFLSFAFLVPGQEKRPRPPRHVACWRRLRPQSDWQDFRSPLSSQRSLVLLIPTSRLANLFD